MWVARDKDNRLFLYAIKPIKHGNDEQYYIPMPHDYLIMEIDKNLFPTLKWEDEPIEVEIMKRGNFNGKI